ncbi:MAG: cytochrome C oxidase subunit IV family protein [Polyangia bacterium]
MTQANAYPNDTNTPGHDEHAHDEPHVLPLATYFAVWGALVVLTVITVAVSRFDFGAANTVIAMFVATVKASLVALFFMHLFYDAKFNLVILLASLLFVSIFFTPVLIDLGTRGALDSLKTRAGYNLANTKPSLEPTAPAAAPAAAPTIQAPTPAHGAPPATPTPGATPPGHDTAPPTVAPGQAAPPHGATTTAPTSATPAAAAPAAPAHAPAHP